MLFFYKYKRKTFDSVIGDGENTSFEEFKYFFISLNVPVPDEKKKLTLIPTLLCGASKGFMKALSSVEIKI